MKNVVQRLPIDIVFAIQPAEIESNSIHAVADVQGGMVCTSRTAISFGNGLNNIFRILLFCLIVDCRF